MESNFARRCAFFAVMAAIIGVSIGTCVQNTRSQISSSVFLSGSWDYMDYFNNGSSNCITMVDRIAASNVHQVQFVPTFHWWDSGPLNPPEGWNPACNGTDLGVYYCFNRFNATEVQHWCYDLDSETGACPEVTQPEIDALVENLGACVAHAVDLGLNVAINARVDDGRQLGGWRNTLAFDPLKQYGEWSYLDAIIYPLADAVARAAAPTTAIDFIVQGEMGATIFTAPESWIEVKPMVEERFLAARADLSASNLKVGLGLNNNKLCGCIGIGISDGAEYLRYFPTGFAETEGEFDLEEVRSVFLLYDFIGLSAYVPMTSTNFSTCEFEGLMVRLDYEFSFYGLTLQALAAAGKEIHWIEFGIGGGYSQAGAEPAPTAEWAAYYPFYGIYGSYDCATDPFGGCEPEVPNAIRDYRRYYYAKAAEYLEQGGCAYEVSSVYVWNLESWDPQGVYKKSFVNEESEELNPDGYEDAVIQQTINDHNDAAASGVLCASSLDVSSDDDELSAAIAKAKAYEEVLRLPGVPAFVAERLRAYEYGGE